MTTGYTPSRPDRHRIMPLYILIDCSDSMVGNALEAVNEGLAMMKRDLMDDARARESIKICVIRFGEYAELYDMVSVRDFTPPELEAEGRTALGAALHLLLDSIQTDLKKPNPGTKAKGDYRPLVFILTDGMPTDEEDFEDELIRLKALIGYEKPVHIVVLGCGNEVNESLLSRITDDWYLMPDITTARDGIRSFIEYATDTVKIQSRTAGTAAATAPLEILKDEKFISRIVEEETEGD